MDAKEGRYCVLLDVEATATTTSNNNNGGGGGCAQGTVGEEMPGYGLRLPRTGRTGGHV